MLLVASHSAPVRLAMGRRAPGRLAIAALVVLPLLGGCQTQEQTGALVGTAGGAVIGGVIGHAIGGSTGTIVGATLGGAAGFFAGSAIGRRLDDQDRARAEAATQQALAQPVTYATPTAQTAAPPPRPVTWNSARNANVSGTSTVTQVQRQPSGGECRMVRETAYIKGEEVVQNNRYCRTASGEWVHST
jgi:surface antigen